MNARDDGGNAKRQDGNDAIVGYSERCLESLGIHSRCLM